MNARAFERVQAAHPALTWQECWERVAQERMHQREARAAEIQAAHPDLTWQECRDGANWERMKANHSRQQQRRFAEGGRRAAHRQCGRGRAARPATNARRRGSSRTSASSTTSSADPGDGGSGSSEGGGDEPPPPGSLDHCCRHCGSALAGLRSHARYCSPACRASAWRAAHPSDLALAGPRKRSYEQGAGA